jgi:holin-like protein
MPGRFTLREATKMLQSLTLLILCQFAGEVITRATNLPLPGPVIGLVLLLVLLVVRGGPDEEMKTTSSGLLRHLLLLFVPAGAGVVTQLDVLGANLLPALAAIIVSTALGLGVTAWVMQRLMRRGPVPPAAGPAA